jgi:hypothetical protein
MSNGDNNDVLNEDAVQLLIPIAIEKVEIPVDYQTIEQSPMTGCGRLKSFLLNCFTSYPLFSSVTLVSVLTIGAFGVYCLTSTISSNH